MPSLCRPALLLVVVLACVLGLLAAPAAAVVRYDWPLAPRPPVVASFDPPAKRWLAGHRGVDLAAADGQPVLAAADGVVAFAGSVGGKPVVSIDHGSIRTTYEPVFATVDAGQPVLRGTAIGTVADGHEGCAAAACLHWGARRGEVYLDPLSLLKPRGVRLLPL